MSRNVLFSLLLITVTANTFGAQNYPGSRRVTCREQNISVEGFFRIVYEQTGMTAFYNDEQLSSLERISVDFRDEPLDNVLAALLRKRGMVWCYRKDVFVIAYRKPGDPVLGELPGERLRTITGLVVNEKGLPLEAVDVRLADQSRGTVTNERGRFIFSEVEENATLLVGKAGYKSTVLSSYADSVYIQLIPMVAPLQEVSVNGVKQNMLTGSVSDLKGAVINELPVNNVLGALQGRIPGLYINQTTGLPGGGYRIRLRGRNSIESVSSPLILIDGLPFPSVSFNENYANKQDLRGPDVKIASMGSNVTPSPLNLITVNDIADIEILKDADATALYGTRGANGVILIKSKTPDESDRLLNVTANYYNGIGQAVNLVRYMDNRQYVQMRKDALRLEMRQANARKDYDLVTWDTARYTDWQKEMIGGTAGISDASLELKGGVANAAYRVSGVYRQETTVYPSDFRYRKGGLMAQIRFAAPDQRFNVAVSGNYVTDKNRMPTTDLTTYSNLPPNTPKTHNNDGTLNFEFGDFENPYAALLRTTKASSQNLRSNVSASFTPIKDLVFTMNMGLNDISIFEVQENPASSRPFDYRDSYFFTNDYMNGLGDLQGSWKKKIGKEQFLLVGGVRFQFEDQRRRNYYGYDYKDDSQMEDTLPGKVIMFLRDDTTYHYHSFFGRLEYRYDNKYLLTLTGSREGSDRLADGNRYANFGSAGAAWIFSNEKWLEKFKLLSFGKLRGSYGITGNDQYVRNNKRETYLPGTMMSGGGMLPGSPDYAPHHTWEKILKAEVALELRFIDNRISGTFSYYNNKSTDQLLTAMFQGLPDNHYTPVNLPAIVKNKGFELDMDAVPLRNRQITWNMNFNMSFPKTKLVSFPNLNQSKYQIYYSEGMSIDLIKGYRLLGVDPATGIYTFEDKASKGNLKEDDRVGRELGPFFYGGWYNHVRYNDLEISCLFRFAKQNNYNYQYAGPYMPGDVGNQPLLVQARWQAAGDNAAIQRYASATNEPAKAAYLLALESDQQVTDASYFRMQSLMLSYNLRGKFLSRFKIKSCKLYMQGLNLFTISNYKGRDPEIIVSSETYPSLRIITAGVQLNIR